ncbi:MAG TPA: hypothetical protein DCK83_03970 [Gallionellaceae bacterium]|nr:hypothetical protein [Gallionellaceae bacterium]
MRTRLSILIPLILVIVSITCSFLVFLQVDRASRVRIEQDALGEIGMEMSRLQNLLYNRLTMGNETDALLDLSLAAMRPGMRALILADESGKVLLANRFRWKGGPAASHSAFSNAEASLVVRSGVSKIGFNPDDAALLQGYYPLVVSYQQGGLKKQMGLLYVESDISAQLKATRLAALEQSLIFGAIILAAALLIAFILHRLVSRRVNVLLAAAGRLALGDYAVKTHMTGSDEISALGKAFDNMAESVSENIALREQATLDQKRVLDTAIDGYWLVDDGGRLLDVNDAYCRMSGYSREELLRMHIPDVEAKEVTLEQVAAHIARIKEQESDRFESIHRRKDGSLIDVEIATTYWKDSRHFFAFVRDISERTRIQKALTERKEQYDRLVANIPVGVYLLLTTQAGVFQFKYASPRLSEILGVWSAAIYADAQAAFDPVHPDDLPEFVALNQQAARTHENFLWEGRILREGEVRWLRIESKPELLENGDCLWDGMVQDITEQKLARLELDLDQERFAEAQKVGHFGSWELNFASGKLIWSDEIFEIFEIDQSKFAASYVAFLNTIHPDDRDRVNQAYIDSLADQKPYQIIHRLQMADGRIKWVEERCSSTFDDSGNPLRSIGTVQDVTERERLAEQARIAAVAFETQEAIIVTDRDANIITVNRAFEEITGYSQEEVQGKNPRMLSSGRHEAGFYKQMWDAINETGRWSGEMWDRRKDGGVYPKWLTITSVKHHDEVTHYVAVFVDISERKKAEEEIKNLAFFDPLTGLPNRRLLLDRLHLALGQSARSENFGALMFIDLDHFKVLNDTKGHEYGDKLLVEVAKRLNTCVRETDTVARFGGDEFIILLEGLSLDQNDAVEQAGRIAEKMRDALSRPYQLGDEQYQSSPSIGVVLFRGDLVTTEELLKQADLAMYKAKDGGRNMVCFFEASMQALLESRTLLENALRQALPNGELELFFQLQTNEAKDLLGAEVLLRWRSAVLGMVSPAEFIPLAEKTKLILPIGDWVLEKACRQLKAWQGHPVLGKMHLAVNISPLQFHQPGFVCRVKTILVDTGADPRLLELELTENLVLEDVREAARKMDELKAFGVRFSMDDFGTGYSSLQYIKQLPIDMLKIDQSFVRDILTDPGDAMMVQTIAGMAHNFGFDVIAEGVETQEQLHPLILCGCEKFQGYLFSKPVSLADFEALVDKWTLEKAAK